MSSQSTSAPSSGSASSVGAFSPSATIGGEAHASTAKVYPKANDSDSTLVAYPTKSQPQTKSGNTDVDAAFAKRAAENGWSNATPYGATL